MYQLSLLYGAQQKVNWDDLRPLIALLHLRGCSMMTAAELDMLPFCRLH